MDASNDPHGPRRYWILRAYAQNRRYLENQYIIFVPLDVAIVHSHGEHIIFVIRSSSNISSSSTRLNTVAQLVSFLIVIMDEKRAMPAREASIKSIDIRVTSAAIIVTVGGYTVGLDGDVVIKLFEIPIDSSTPRSGIGTL